MQRTREQKSGCVRLREDRENFKSLRCSLHSPVERSRDGMRRTLVLLKTRRSLSCGKCLWGGLWRASFLSLFLCCSAPGSAEQQRKREYVFAGGHPGWRLADSPLPWAICLLPLRGARGAEKRGYGAASRTTLLKQGVNESAGFGVVPVKMRPMQLFQS